VFDFVQNCRSVDHYQDALDLLLERRSRLYDAIKMKEIQKLLPQPVTDDEDDFDDEQDEFYPNDDDDPLTPLDQLADVLLDHPLYKSLQFVAFHDEDSEEEKEQHIRVHDFQCHPTLDAAISCDEMGRLKLWKIARNEICILKCGNMRRDVQKDDHRALCCTIVDNYVAFGGLYGDGKGLVVCYEIEGVGNNDVSGLKIEFIVDSDCVSSEFGTFGAVHSLQFDEYGSYLFVGTVGQILLVNDSGQCIQTVGIQHGASSPVNALCVHSNSLFALTDKQCTAYSLDFEHETPILVGSALTVCSVDKDYAFGPLRHLGVTDFEQKMAVYVASSRLEWYLVSIDEADGTLSLCEESGAETVDGKQTPILSVQIDSSYGVVAFSRRRSVKAYRVGLEEHEVVPEDCKGSGMIGITRKRKTLAICHEDPCFVELRKYLRR